MASESPSIDLDVQDELLELFDALVNVIFVMKGRDGRYTAVNQAFVRRIGRKSKRDVIGRRASELFSPALAERYEEQDTKVFETGESLRDELELIRRTNGSLGWYLTMKLPVVDDDGEVAAIASISRDLEVPSADRVEMEALTRVVDEVGRCLAEKHTVAGLADLAGCSPRQLERRMKRVFGLTVTQYVLRRRVDQAAQLLSETELPLAEIATTCGFYDQANFTRRFARLTNETPAAFRSNHTSAR